MRFGAVSTAILVGLSVLLVVALLAAGFGVSVGGAWAQAAPLALAGALAAGLLVASERREAA